MWTAGILLGASVSLSAFPLRKHKLHEARVEIRAGKALCSVDVDGTPEGKTGSHGTLTLDDVSPSDHYIHVVCAGKPEMIYFISPSPGSALVLTPQDSLSPAAKANSDSLAVAERDMAMRRLFREATNYRSNGQFPQAIETLRRAIQVDPENPNLHHELGETFLMVQQWDSARVELLEALRHDPNSAGLHNGLGYAYEKLGDLRAALDQYRLASRLDPTDGAYQDRYLEALAEFEASQPHKKKRRK